MQKFEQSVVVDGETVTVIRSAKRSRTISADLVAGQLRLRVPMRVSDREVLTHARAFHRRLAEQRTRSAGGDEALMVRAQELSRQYFDSAAHPSSVAWSNRQLRRWGSTTSVDSAIRLSTRLQKMPGWVVDSVLIHELAHLIEPGHGPRFQQLVDRYPRTAEADAFLAGVSWAQQHLPGASGSSAG